MEKVEAVTIIRNYIQEALIDFKASCTSTLKCDRIIQLEAHVKEKLSSDLKNVSKELVKMVESINTISEDIIKIKDTLKFDANDIDHRIEKVNGQLDIASTLIKSAKDTQKDNRAMIWALVIITFGLGVGKIWQDKVNQEQTTGYLRELSSTIEVLKDHDIQFQKHLMVNRDLLSNVSVRKRIE